MMSASSTETFLKAPFGESRQYRLKTGERSAKSRGNEAGAGIFYLWFAFDS